jgi:hypothetical protein
MAQRTRAGERLPVSWSFSALAGVPTSPPTLAWQAIAVTPGRNLAWGASTP